MVDLVQQLGKVGIFLVSIYSLRQIISQLFYLETFCEYKEKTSYLVVIPTKKRMQ